MVNHKANASEYASAGGMPIFKKSAVGKVAASPNEIAAALLNGLSNRSPADSSRTHAMLPEIGRHPGTSSETDPPC